MSLTFQLLSLSKHPQSKQKWQEQAWFIKSFISSQEEQADLSLGQQ